MFYVMDSFKYMPKQGTEFHFNSFPQSYKSTIFPLSPNYDLKLLT